MVSFRWNVFIESGGGYRYLGKVSAPDKAHALRRGKDLLTSLCSTGLLTEPEDDYIISVRVRSKQRKRR